MRNAAGLLTVVLLFSGCGLFQGKSGSGNAISFLHEGWEFRQAGGDLWRPAEVPGSVHTDLMNSVIEDPFFRDNEASVQWVGKTGWEYRLEFDGRPYVDTYNHIELVFEGLDTYARVFLNGESILDADNMFRAWSIRVDSLLHPEANVLTVSFRSPIMEVLPRMESMEYQLPASNDQGEKTSPYTRKAPYHFGWDWGPRLVTSGIWRPVFLRGWNDLILRDTRFTQTALNEKQADLMVGLEAEVAASIEAEFRVLVNGKTLTKRVFMLQPGINDLEFPLVIHTPRLWWPNGLGEPYLYDVRVEVLLSGRIADVSQQRIGIRTLELRREPDEWGESFAFVVNGVPVFAKGGNWIPADNFVSRVTRERYEHLLKSCRDAHMNMLRVWGGGIYEHDDFYDLCDEMGILIWQDFMFACSMVPGDESFLSNVEQEAVYQVKRLRNHPCLALWCGNNEGETAWFNWGWKEELPASVWDDYLALFHDLLPGVIREHDFSRAYWPSSPSSNLLDDANSPRMGNAHYWGVWHGALPFSEYEKQFHRFQSEYGFQSFPLMPTVEKYTWPGDRDIESPVMLAHQKHPRGNELIREYMLRDFPKPRDFESFLYVSQILQAEGIRMGAEHFRRIMPGCMGSLYWQINDCWPVASWSSIDYYGRWKALHYYARRFYAPLLLSIEKRSDSLIVHGVSDRLEPVKGLLTVYSLTFDGTVGRSAEIDVDLMPGQSQVCLRLDEEEWFTGLERTESFLRFELNSPGREAVSAMWYPLPYREMKRIDPELTVEVLKAGSTPRLRVRTRYLARGVYVQASGVNGRFSDNFFDMPPGSEKVIHFFPARTTSRKELSKMLRVRSLADAF
ncbi:MAG TPA: glycoside hydrolase family 2 protein [bacterium]|nr:glycoside hydrolase family 2 protein [bacterium]